MKDFYIYSNKAKVKLEEFRENKEANEKPYKTFYNGEIPNCSEIFKLRDFLEEHNYDYKFFVTDDVGITRYQITVYSEGERKRKADNWTVLYSYIDINTALYEVSRGASRGLLEVFGMLDGETEAHYLNLTADDVIGILKERSE